MAGEHSIADFRNKDLRARLFPLSSLRALETTRKGARVSRPIRKLRGHSLVAKVPGSRLHRVTARGQRVMVEADTTGESAPEDPSRSEQGGHVPEGPSIFNHLWLLACLISPRIHPQRFPGRLLPRKPLDIYQAFPAQFCPQRCRLRH